MKETCICPKCKSADVTKVKAYKATSTNNMILLTKWGTHYTFFDRYVCLSCGFIEHYINLEDKSWQKWVDKQREERTLDSDFV